MFAMPRRQRLTVVGLAVVTACLTIFLRIRRLDTTGLWGDQAFLLNTAMRWVNGGPIPLAANKSSIGTMHGPMIEYLYALALWLWPDILSVAVLTMICGVLAVALTAWATYKTFGRKAALVTALLFAVNPWSVYYSQLIWNPTMVPLFSSLTLTCLLLYFGVDQRPVYLIAGLAAAAVMTQIHPGTAVQLLTLIAACVLFHRKVRLWPLFAGGILFALVHLPYMLYELAVGGHDLRGFLELTQEPAPLSPAAVLVSLDLMRAKGLLASVDFASTFDTLATVLLTVSLIHAMWTVARALIRRRDSREARDNLPHLIILLLWFALPILFNLRSSHYLQTHYLIGQLPAHFVLIGAAVVSLGHRLERLASPFQRRIHRFPGRSTGWAVVLLPLVALIGWQCFFNLRFQDHRYHATRGPAQIRHFREAVRSSLRLLDIHPACDLVALSDGHSLETSELSLLREFVSRDQVLLADGSLAVPVPAPCAVYLDAQGETATSTWLNTSAEPIASETLHVLGDDWRFYQLAFETWVPQTPPASSTPMWTNGISLVGHERGELRPGRTLPLTLTWDVERPVPDRLYHFGTYLLTPTDHVVAQSDGPGFDSIQWSAGDSFITWFDIPVPETLEPGTYTLGVALYTWPEVERIPLSTGDTTAFLEEIRVGEP